MNLHERSSSWELVFRGYDPEAEPLREALCALGNGVFVTRGAAEESIADGTHYPGTYLAGGYNRLVSRVGDQEISNEDLVNFPNWLPLTFRIGKEPWFDLSAVEIIDFDQRLLMREGILERRCRFRDAKQRETTLLSRRIVSMADPHFAALMWLLVPDNWSGSLQIRSLLDGRVGNAGVSRYRQLRGDHLEVLGTGESDGCIWLHAKTTQSRIEIVEASRMMISGGSGGTIRMEGRALPRVAQQEIALDVTEGEAVHLEKIVSIHTSRDPAVGDLREDAVSDVLRHVGFDALEDRHARAWHDLWDRCDVQVEVEDGCDLEPFSIQCALRAHAFHLLQTASANTVGRDVGIPARGWHGEAYRGHVFWDEMFVLPFYSRVLPDVASSLMMYRVRRLDAARDNASLEGLEGALFPWQSGSSGREESQRIHLNPRSGAWEPDRSRLQRHVNAAIVLEVLRYVREQNDHAFMRRYGIDLITEIARLWASLALWNDSRHTYEIAGVVGPDEFHEFMPGLDEAGLRNNAYTNIIASWCLRQAIVQVERLDEAGRRELSTRTGLRETEIDRWRDIASRMWVPTDHEGTIEAFEGYSQLLDLDWDAYRVKYGRIGRLDRILRAEGDSPDRYKLSKQADLVMLLYVLPASEWKPLLASLGHPLTDEDAVRLVDRYEQRTSHGSTLSHIVFAGVLADMRQPGAWEHFTAALCSDVEDTQGGTTSEGIHAAIMAGTIRHVVERLAGIRVTADALAIRSGLPKQLRSVRVPMEFRGRHVHVCVEPGSVRIEVGGGGAPGEAVPVDVNGQRVYVPSGGWRTVST